MTVYPTRHFLTIARICYHATGMIHGFGVSVVQTFSMANGEAKGVIILVAKP
jgi:hypothetical protein